MSEAVARFSLGCNCALAALKTAAGLAGGSFALVADGVESFADAVASLVIWNGVRVGARAPDADHPYGHGKAEALAALFAGAFLVLTGLAIAVQATRELHSPSQVSDVWVVPVLAAVIAIKELLHWHITRAARAADSPALRAEAAHHRADSLTSIGVFLGLIITAIGGPAWAAAEDLAALAVSGLIVWNGTRICRPAVDELLDRRIAGERWELVERAAAAVPGVLAVETLILRRSGNRVLVDIHLEVDPILSVAAGHRIAHAVKDALLADPALRIGAVQTHVEPHRETQPTGRREG